MPKFVDSSYVMRDVNLLKKDVKIYQDENLSRIHNELKEIFLTKELDNYKNVKELIDLLQFQLEKYPSNINVLYSLFNLDKTELDMESVSELSNKLNTIWEKYRVLTNDKQFYIRQSPNDVLSIEDLLDKVAKKGADDKDLLQLFLKNNLEGLINTSANQISPVWDKLMAEDYMDTLMRPFYRTYQNFVIEKMSNKYEKLYKNFAGIFFKVLNGSMEMDRLKEMLTMIHQVETGRMTQHNASVKIGKKLGDKYMSHIKPKDKQ